jgi:hypothetical protein
VTCHNERLKTAGLLLDKMDPAHPGADAAKWEKVAIKLRAGTMPPLGSPRPDKATYESVATAVENALDREAANNVNPGRTSPHRLNRTEYGNAIRDLLDLTIDPTAYLPADDTDLGFDNMADILSVSPALLERSMSAARKISRLAVGDPVPRPASTYLAGKMKFQDYRMDEALPFGSRGGLAVRHYFPADGEYTVKITLKKNLYDLIKGLQTAQKLEVRLDGQKITVFDVGPAPGRPAPRSLGGATAGSPDWEVYSHEMDKYLSIRFTAPAGPHVVGVSFLQTRTERDYIMQPRPTGKPLATDEGFSSASEAPEAAVDSVTVDGPYNVTGLGDTPSRRKIFVCRPTKASEEEACAKTILSKLGRRAYRRPLTGSDVEPLMAFYKTARSEGKDFDSGIQRGLEAILASPEFLFRIERDPANIAPGTNYRLSDVELASRLSFFLWSSIPDDELLDVAAAGKLKDPAVLERQVKRMLADERATALVDNFASEWLQLRKMRTVAPVPEWNIYFDDNLRDGFEKETKMFIESQIREDRSLVDLLRANYSFLNERLAQHYGVPNIYGSRFRRVEFKDGIRGGLLGQGSILTLTSYPNRTSVVLRGHWLLDNILGAPPNPPPPNVPSLPDKGEDGKPASNRELLERHRKNPVCANCHAGMDPLGFALENFDPIGQWRELGPDMKPVDATGSLLDGTKFEGLAGLKAMLMSRQADFVRAVTEKLLIYSLGRGLSHSDAPVVRQVVRQAAPGDYRWSSIILGITKSTPFQMRRSES